MAYENKPGFGALFKNKDKGDNPARPDYNGDFTHIDGTKMKIAGWMKDGAKGKFMSLKVELPMSASDAKPEPESGVGAGGSGLDDEIPFAPEWR